jgi:hypothetical protein
MRADPQVLCHPHEIGQRTGSHFAHNVSAMKLDGRLGNFQFACDLLIQQAGYHLLHDVLLARGQGLVPISQINVDPLAVAGSVGRARWPPELRSADPVHPSAWSGTQSPPLSLLSRRLVYRHGL